MFTPNELFQRKVTGQLEHLSIVYEDLIVIKTYLLLISTRYLIEQVVHFCFFLTTLVRHY